MARPRRPWRRWLTRRVGHPVEAALVHLCLAVFRALPIDRASDLGGWIGRTVGPWLPSSGTARRNLARAFPGAPREETEAILRGMWDNLGRTVAEYPHLDAIADPEGGRIEMVGADEIAAMRDDGRAGIIVSGHLANWEVPSVVSRKAGLELALVYRAPNNPFVDTLLTRLRGAASATHVPKGADGARTLIRILGHGGHVGMLIDQKMNDGIPIPFFGRTAMTAPAAAQLALRFDIPIRPSRIERLGGARFRVTLLPPIETPSTGNRNADVRTIMEGLNALLEGWVRERPTEWLWMHRRWPD